MQIIRRKNNRAEGSRDAIGPKFGRNTGMTLGTEGSGKLL
jgi:hypothetical protein